MSGGCCGWGYSSWNCGWHGTAVVYHGGAYYGNSAWHGGYYNGGYHGGYGYNNSYNHNNYNNVDRSSDNTFNRNTSETSERRQTECARISMPITRRLKLVGTACEWRAANSNAFSGLSGHTGGFGPAAAAGPRGRKAVAAGEACARAGLAGVDLAEVRAAVADSAVAAAVASIPMIFDDEKTGSGVNMSHQVRDQKTQVARLTLGTALLMLLASMVAFSKPGSDKPESATPEKALQKTFASPADAGATFFGAAKSANPSALLAIFGPSAKAVLLSGDAVKDSDALKDFVAAYTQMHRWRRDQGRRADALHRGR